MSIPGGWLGTARDFRLLQDYKATGLSPEQIMQMKRGALPVDEDRAPLPPLNTWHFAGDTSAAMGLLEEEG